MEKKGTSYQVYKTREEAEAALAKLKAAGYKQVSAETSDWVKDLMKKLNPGDRVQ